jgi:predicted nucleic acid-binding protein
VTGFTIDASVFLNAFNPHEQHHADSQALLAQLRERAELMLAPALLLPETAASISRVRGDSRLALQFTTDLERLAHLTLISLDATLARQAAGIAANYRLRGGDAVYAAVALRFGSTLVTLDREQRKRVSGLLPARFPAEALAEL